MTPYSVNELRQMFLDFFAEKDHYVVKSFSLVPQNDKSLLLINAGMAPLKPYFTGQEIPPSTRMASCQKCIRTGDIDNVGKTARHGTFFEMLGNFSFGDYFKKEALAWSWEFLTEWVGLDPERLYPSVYQDDDEAYDIWKNDLHIPEEKIFRFGKEDNFWEHGAGPCGPCSEIYYDRGEAFGCGKPTCTVGCDCDRYVEIWNDVFTQFEGDGKGNYVPLEKKNIDTGMGLERLAAVVQDVPSIFDVDTVRSLREHVCRIAGVEYKGGTSPTDVSVRVITDHVRSVSFMASDGILPSNEGRGYVFRRLLRRACRHGRLLGIEGKFLLPLVDTVIEGSKDGYPELEEKRDFIHKVIAQEEEQFNKTLDQGLAILNDYEKDMAEKGVKVLNGGDAFRLYDTFGFPLDLTKDILAERGYDVDEEGFAKAMAIQKETARKARKTTNYMGADASVYELLDPALESVFTGYGSTEGESKVIALTTEADVVDTLSEGDAGTLFTAETPFYATSGGQEADTGLITAEGFTFRVDDTQKILGNKIGHTGVVLEGSVSVGDAVKLSIDVTKRNLTARNHSATHLLDQALKDVLGGHVEQAGSQVRDDELRFDFTHFQAMTPEEVSRVEKIVNEKIQENLAVVTKVMSIDEARKTGAAALFGEKYGEKVRVVFMGDYSKEFCGGTHVSETGSIGSFKIISESGIAAGVRRIEARTSAGLMDYYEKALDQMAAAAAALKTNPEQLAERIGKLLQENKALHSEIESLKNRINSESAGDLVNSAADIGGIRTLAAEVPDMGMNDLREMGDKLKEQLGECVVTLISQQNGRVFMMVTATDAAAAAGANAGAVIKEIAPIVGGGGGGKPKMAQAGGKDPSGIPGALEKAREVMASQLA